MLAFLRLIIPEKGVARFTWSILELYTA